MWARKECGPHHDGVQVDVSLSALARLLIVAQPCCLEAPAAPETLPTLLCMQAAPGGGGQGPAEAYGLLGLLGVINMNDSDVTMLALGTDLTSLGLHLNGMDALYLTFASPWADNPIKPEPSFKVLR